MIDWSDAEGMFGLLLEFVADEKAECGDDRERGYFLDGLLKELELLRTQNPEMAGAPAVEGLREILDTQPAVFAKDPVIVHVEDCIHELERVEQQRIPRPVRP